jgi:hypothetical protein
MRQTGYVLLVVGLLMSVASVRSQLVMADVLPNAKCKLGTVTCGSVDGSTCPSGTCEACDKPATEHICEACPVGQTGQNCTEANLSCGDTINSPCTTAEPWCTTIPPSSPPVAPWTYVVVGGHHVACPVANVKNCGAINSCTIPGG